MFLRCGLKWSALFCFQGSKNCKKELNYADAQTKSIVPVMCEKGFKAQGWLGIITAGLLWIDFRQTKTNINNNADDYVDYDNDNNNFHLHQEVF